MMRVCYAKGYEAPLPAGHPFPMEKFSALHRILLQDGVLRPQDVVEPDACPWEDLALVHQLTYLNAWREGTLTAHAQQRLGLPWSPQLVRRSRLAVSGTLLAARMAIEDGIAGNLAGGAHHAFPDRGEGFCALNDVAVAVRVLIREGRAKRFLIIDLDAHQGDGTASIFSGNPDIFTFSLHGRSHYPYRKIPSSRDVGFSDSAGDLEYLCCLRRELPAILESFQPQLAFYLAGVDVLADDRFGRIGLTPAGLRLRDSLVFKTMRDAAIPCCLLLSGGYAATAARTAFWHAQSFRQAIRVFG